jgi:dolichyl-phosphate-mannose-protein mannosyltransferase
MTMILDREALTEDGTPARLASARASLARLLPLLVVGAVAAVTIGTLGPWPVGIFEDDGMYVILGKALAEGHGYRFLNLPGAPYGTHFPPGYPAFLAAMWKLFPRFPDNVFAFKIANCLLVAFAALMTVRYLRDRLRFSIEVSSAVAVLAMATVPILLLTAVVMSEPLFVALLMPAVIVGERAAAEGKTRDALLAGVLCGVLTLVRTLGAVLLPAILLVLLWRRRWRAAALALAAGVAIVAPWQLWASAHAADVDGPLLGKYGAYLPWLAAGFRHGGLPFAWGVVQKNVGQLAGFFSYALMPTVPPWPRLTTLALLTVLVAVGMRELWRRSLVAALFTVLYGGVVLLWPFEPTRFMLAIVPLVAATLALGIRGIAEWGTPVAGPWALARRGAKGVLLAGCGALLVGYMAYNLRGVRQRWWESMQRTIADQAKPTAEWTRRYTRPDDVVAADHDALVYLYTGRQAVPYLSFTPESYLTVPSDSVLYGEMRAIIGRYRPKYLLIGGANGLRVARQLEHATPPEVRYLGSIRTGLIFEAIPHD